MKFCLEPMLDKDRKREGNNRLRDWRRENQEEAKQVAIATQQSITQNRWRGNFHFTNNILSTSTYKKGSSDYSCSN